jgi:integrase
MSSKRKRGEVWEYTFKKAGVLDKPLYLTFPSEEVGDAYAEKLDALLDRGIVPTEFQAVSRITSIESLVRIYLRDAHVKPKDTDLLGTVCSAVGNTPLISINAKWVDDWISDMKRINKLAPATIRGKVGALARCTDWGMRKGLLLMPDHPFRTLPDGYASYTKLDVALAGEKREDIERDRRLEMGEFERIMAVIDVGVLPRKQRPYALPDKAALRTMFVLALESAMRLREMYTLTVDQVDFKKKTIFLEKTKNGDKRQVPLTSVAFAALEDYLLVRSIAPGHLESALFPWWDGRMERMYLRDRSDFLSKLFISIFTEAKCDALKFHDLRHEATSRIYERTSLTDLQISKITGHRSLTVLRRYANLRGSDLSSRMW